LNDSGAKALCGDGACMRLAIVVVGAVNLFDRDLFLLPSSSPLLDLFR
jgi:hypothetical protein